HVFEDESELRMIYKSADPQDFTRSFKFPLEAIVEIELNPWLPESVFESIRSIISRIDGCKNIPVTQSHMLTNVEWRNLLTRVPLPRPPRYTGLGAGGAFFLGGGGGGGEAV